MATRLALLSIHRLRQPSPSLERFALGLGLASAVSLAVAAFVVFSNPRGAAWSHLDDLSTRTRQNVREVWSSLTAVDAAAGDEARFLDPEAELIELDPSNDLDSSRAPVAQSEGPVDSGTVFEALLAESERAEFSAGRERDALALASEATLKEAPPARLALARLRAIQLAAALDEEAAVREHWDAAGDIAPDIAHGDTSTLLLCALAALPKLDDSKARAAIEQVMTLWTNNALVLPASGRRFEVLAGGASERAVYRADLRETALRERLLASAADAAELSASFAQLDAAWKRQAFLDFIGTPIVASPQRDRWSLLAGRGGLLALRENSAARRVVQWTSLATVESALHGRLAAQSALPEGFFLDLGGDDDARGQAVGAWIDLGSAFPRATLRHPDLEGVLRGVESRTLWLRGGLLVLALFVAGAAFATHHALRRERKLAQARTSFVANVSHELRTPLAALLLMAENLERGRAGDDPARYHGLIKREVLRLRRLVEDALDFSRMERGMRFQARVEDVDLAAWFEGLCADARELAARAGLEISCSSSIASSHAAFDGEALRRAALNLVDNAVRHSGTRAIELAIEVRGARLVLSVGDHGRGIPPRQREAVFEPFLRLAGSEHTAGAGLGLAIVREIAHAHGGSVRAQATPSGSGATFEIEIPLAESLVDEGAVAR